MVTVTLESFWMNTGTGASATVSGTVIGATEVDIRAGGKTIIITLSGDTWVASGASFDAIRGDIIAGLDASGSPTNGWNNVVQAGQSVGGVVRTSDTVVTITLDAFPTYNITANETITVTVPATAVVLASPITATPTFDISYVISFRFIPTLAFMGVG